METEGDFATASSMSARGAVRGGGSAGRRPRLGLRSAAAVVLLYLWLSISTATSVNAVDGPASPVDGPASAADEAFFESKIRPVLVEHCYECHATGAEVQGGLLVDSRTALRAGGDSGPAIVPHDPEASLLIAALRYSEFEMPPRGPLPEAVIADFEHWIESGAPDPRDEDTVAVSAEGDANAVREHWAFKPLPETPMPPSVHSDWAYGAIDQFIYQRLDESGSLPAADADPRTLLRRLYFDLTGLPPTRDRLQAFLRDPSPEAFANEVERLLESPRFGERWAQHWLDLARYSESTGGGRSALYGSAWRYRDYVIDAFNNDVPYDQFIVQQIAGDLLPYETATEGTENLVATAFLMLGPHNYENQDKAQLRMDVVDEQVDVLGRVFLGMTVGCARCHDHKFDPIPTKDYYALAGIFRSTEMLVDGNVSSWTQRDVPVPPSELQALNAHRAAVADLQQQLTDRRAELQEAQQRLPSQTIDDDQAELTGSWTNSSSVKGFVGKGYIHTTDADAFARYRFSVPQPGRYEIRLSYTQGENRSSAARVILQHADEESTHSINQRQQAPIDGRWISIGQRHLEGATTVEIHGPGSGGHVIADAVQLVWLGPNAEAAEGDGAELAEVHARIRRLNESIEAMQAELEQLEQSAPPPPERVMAVKEAKDAGDCHLCIRGNVHNLGPTVPRGVLSAVSDDPQLQIAAGESGRLELAQWIASSENPLTARVMVNRVWHHLLGTGIVRTVDNFGTRGEQPSHPELLDYLAVRFVQQGWSIKSVIRDIVHSRTYQLSSRRQSSAASSDPENRLFSRQNRRRRDAEALRDAILSLSGRLDFTAGGNTVRPGTQSEYGYTFDSHRRGVYLPVFRNRLPDMFAVFDFADPNISVGQRNVSTLSTQALYLMNSPLMMQHAEAAAERLLADPAKSPQQRIDHLYEEAFGRLPTAEERRIAGEFIDETSDVEDWARLCQAAMASIDFLYVR